MFQDEFELKHIELYKQLKDILKHV